jgi:hypothetical protein
MSSFLPPFRLTASEWALLTWAMVDLPALVRLRLWIDQGAFLESKSAGAIRHFPRPAGDYQRSHRCDLRVERHDIVPTEAHRQVSLGWGF